MTCPRTLVPTEGIRALDHSDSRWDAGGQNGPARDAPNPTLSKRPEFAGLIGASSAYSIRDRRPAPGTKVRFRGGNLEV